MPIAKLTTTDLAEIEPLLDRSFGPGRQQRTASILRRGAAMVPDLCFVMRDEAGALLASVQCWQIWLATPSAHHPVILLGPLAVEPDRRGQGFGVALMEAACEAAGARPMVLIGDEPYYGRFGFSAAHTGGWTVPGPVERHRLLARNAEGLPAEGVLVSKAEVQRAA